MSKEKISDMLPFNPSDFIQSMINSGFLDKNQAAHEDTMQEVYDSLKGVVSQMLSVYHAQNIFIRCPACGNDYCISDPEAVACNELYDCYQQRRGKNYKLQCDQIYSKEFTEHIHEIIGCNRPACKHIFNLHEGIVEYRAQTAVESFARGPYTVLEEGTSNIFIGQSVQPKLLVGFSCLDYVNLYSNQEGGNLANIYWRRVSGNENRFEILTSAENKDNLGKSIKINWQVVGLRNLSDDERRQIENEHWRGYLISAARKLLYEHDPKTSILESETAFELFLEKFIEDNWTFPHLKENKDYLRYTGSFSIETNVRILLHEALGIHFVKSDLWKDWLWSKAFRNQIAHGKPLSETKYEKKVIGKNFKDSVDIAKFCYSSIVRAIYFIRYWNI